jgi:transposase-like protein
VGKYPKEFRRMAVERLKTCDNIVELSQELGVHRRLLYKWRDQLKLTLLMGIRKGRGFPQPLEKSLAKDARLFHSSHRPTTRIYLQ